MVILSIKLSKANNQKKIKLFGIGSAFVGL